MAKSQRRVSDGLRRVAGLGAVVIGGAGSLLMSGPFGLAAAAVAGAGAVQIFAGPRGTAETFAEGDGLDAVRHNHFDRVTGAGVWRTCLKTDKVYWDPRMREIFETPPDFETSRGLSSRFFTREGRRDFLDAVEATRRGTL